MPEGLDWRWGGKLPEDPSASFPSPPAEPSTPRGFGEFAAAEETKNPTPSLEEADKAAARRLLLLQLFLVGGSLLFWALRLYLGGDGDR
jgi:hypothetical protein